MLQDIETAIARNLPSIVVAVLMTLHDSPVDSTERFANIKLEVLLSYVCMDHCYVSVTIAATVHQNLIFLTSHGKW